METRKNRCGDRGVLLRELNPELRIWDVLVDPARKIRIGKQVALGR